jgi:putative redox protein
MKITLRRLDDAFHMEAMNETGNTIQIDSSPNSGGQNKGVRPMQLMLMSLAGCSSIDVITILKKQKQEITDYHVTVEGERESGKEPSLFTKIHIHFSVKGNVEEEKLKRAIELSVGKYCSAAKTLEKTAVITWGYEKM